MDVKKISTIIILLCGFYAFPKSIENELRDFKYHVELNLVERKNMLDSLRNFIAESDIATEINQTRTIMQSGKQIVSMNALINRINHDVKLIRKKAQKYGFYDVEISYKTTVVNMKNVTVQMYIDLGKIFALEADVQYIDQNKDFNRVYIETLNEQLKNLSASMNDIKLFAEMTIRELQKKGFFNPKIISKKIHINYEKKSVIFHIALNAGKKVVFSDAKINAFSGISDQFIQNRIAWNKGELFDITKVEDTLENLKNSQIFASLKVEPDEKNIKDNNVPMIIELTEDKKHIVDLSLIYSGVKNMNFEKNSQTQKKLKSIVARLAWTRCNAFSGGETLSVMAEGVPMRAQSKRADYVFDVNLSQPDILWKNNKVNYSASKKQELTNVFFKKSDKMSLMCNYPFAPDVFMIAGVAFEKNYVDSSDIFFQEEFKIKRYNGILVPVELLFDKTNDLLNPTSGYRASIKFTKMFLQCHTLRNLNMLDIRFSYNYPLNNLRDTVLAFNIEKRNLFGKRIDCIPTDKRIYAGGMHSVRGYGNQMATEKIIGIDNYMGGKSSIEFNSEIRKKLSADLGGVLFFDGAKIFQNTSEYPNLKTEKKRWFLSTGFGIRYFTSIGPIRIDFAFPIKKRRGVDSKMQFIMSLGQAF